MARNEINNAQSEHAPPASAYDVLIEKAVTRTLDHLHDRPIPVRARLLREQAAARYIGVDGDYLRVDRAEAKRLGKPPRFAFRRLGNRVLYDLADLDAGIDALPRVAGQADAMKAAA